MAVTSFLHPEVRGRSPSLEGRTGVRPGDWNSGMGSFEASRAAKHLRMRMGEAFAIDDRRWMVPQRARRGEAVGGVGQGGIGEAVFRRIVSVASKAARRTTPPG